MTNLYMWHDSFICVTCFSHKPHLCVWDSLLVFANRLFTCVASRMLQCVAVCSSVLQCAAVCCSVLQCVAVCYNVLQCVASRMHHCDMTHFILGSYSIYRVATISRLLQIICLFAEYSLFCRALLQKRPVILRSLLIVANPCAYTQA